MSVDLVKLRARSCFKTQIASSDCLELAAGIPVNVTLSVVDAVKRCGGEVVSAAKCVIDNLLDYSSENEGRNLCLFRLQDPSRSRQAIGPSRWKS